MGEYRRENRANIFLKAAELLLKYRSKILAPAMPSQK